MYFIRLICISFLFVFTLLAQNVYPPIEPYETGFLPVEGGHTLYFEQSGNPNGKPILFLHGGPGIGTSPSNRQFFDPDKYRIILFDQRGCGKSHPFSSLENNTTWDLVNDIEEIREHLGIDSWYLFGGSWGSTLALCYGIKHPDRVRGFILRGIYLCRPKEIQWYYQSGANQLFPDLWENYISLIPLSERDDIVAAFYKRLLSDDSIIRNDAAMAWSGWEGATTKLTFDPAQFNSYVVDDKADSIARIECHYFINNIFFDTDNWILENVDKISHIPAILIHGRYDIPCPLENAWELHLAWPKSKLEIISDAGHAASEPGILQALIKATDYFADNEIIK